MHPRKIIFALACLLATLTVSQAEEPLKVFVLAGQSNMVGKRSVAADLEDPALKEMQEDVLFFTGEDWVPLKPGVSEQEGFGPEISFAHGLQKKLGEPIGIIKYSRGGTNLHVQWHPEGKTSLYRRLHDLVDRAKESRDIQIVGMLWMQGEADSKNEEMATAYASNLTNFIYTARKHFGNPDMAFVAGRVNPPKERYPWVDLVREAQENPEVSGYSWIDCDGLEKVSDNVHYSTSGYVKMGHLFAEKMLELMEE